MFQLHKRLGFVAYKPDDGAGGGGSDDRVPRDRLNEVLDQRDEARRALAEAERKDMAEVDRLKAELADAKSQLDETNTKLAAETQRADKITEDLQTQTREGWIRAAASRPETTFHDPDDAISKLSKADIKTEDAARKAVDSLAESAKHLVKPVEPDTAATRLEQVLAGGKPVTGSDTGKDGETDKTVIAADKFEALTQDQLVALQESDPELYQRSLAAAATADGA